MAKLIIGNWKLNPQTEKKAVNLARSSDFKNVVIAPPFLFIPAVKKVVKKASIGAQDVFWENSGAYTGCVSATQLKHLGVEYVIVGHSERRYYFKETNRMINKKVKNVLKEGLKVVLCVGENLSMRKKGINAAKKFIKRQLTESLLDLRSSVIDHQTLLIAYEPVWAIGTGYSDKPEEVVKVVRFIKDFLANTHKASVKVFYGGSVDASNASDFLSYKEIDGLLVGSISLKPKEFIKIVNVAS